MKKKHIENAKTSAMSNEIMKAPWLDYLDNELFEGDTIIHPNGEKGIIGFYHEFNEPADQWRVDYGTNVTSRLCLQVGDKGQAIKFDA